MTAKRSPWFKNIFGDAEGDAARAAAEAERLNGRQVLGAIGDSYATIEFDLAGTVLAANANFLGLMGYSLDEVVGKHHRMFVAPADAAAPAYAQFWTDLNSGQPQSHVFKRVTKTGREVWIQAIYAPVKDEAGKVLKIVKLATDVTAEQLVSADFQGPDPCGRQVAGGDRIQPRRQNPRCQCELPRRDRLHARRDPRPAPQSLRRAGHAGQRRVPPVLGKARPPASSMPANTSASPRAVARSGSRLRTTRSWT